MSEMFENLEAMTPMYGDDIVFHATRPSGARIDVSLKGCVFRVGDSEPISSEMDASDVDEIDVSIRDCDWPYIQEMKRGDSVEYDHRQYKIVRPRHDSILGYTFRARSTDGGAA